MSPVGGALIIGIFHRGQGCQRIDWARLRAAGFLLPAGSSFVTGAVCICDLGLQTELSTEEKIIVYTWAQLPEKYGVCFFLLKNYDVYNEPSEGGRTFILNYKILNN